jgi:hypothetical protein
MKHGDVICFRLSTAMRQTLGTAAASLGTTKAQLIRAVVVQALRHEAIARAAIEDPNKPEYPSFTSELRA